MREKSCCRPNFYSSSTTRIFPPPFACICVRQICKSFFPRFFYKKPILCHTNNLYFLKIEREICFLARFRYLISPLYLSLLLDWVITCFEGGGGARGGDRWKWPKVFAEWELLAKTKTFQKQTMYVNIFVMKRFSLFSRYIALDKCLVKSVYLSAAIRGGNTNHLFSRLPLHNFPK